jgi:alpha-beta hydrolase superfamily lysophospholipase
MAVPGDAYCREGSMLVWEEDFAIEGFDGEVIPVHRWRSDRGPRAIVQLAHGWGEHALRYREFARALVLAGYVVYANDHRGHGLAVGHRGQLGDFERVGFAGLIRDMGFVSDVAKCDYPGVPLILLGHSMGSYAAQSYALDHSDAIAGLALVGGSSLDLRCSKLGKYGWFTADNNAAFWPARTPYDFISRDHAVVDAFIDDPLCGFVPSAGSQKSLLVSAPRLSRIEEMRRIRSDLPILLFTGDRDPVNGFLAYFAPLAERYRSAGLDDVETRIYAGARHQVLHETNRAEVTADFIAWLSRLPRHVAGPCFSPAAPARVSHLRSYACATRPTLN